MVNTPFLSVKQQIPPIKTGIPYFVVDYFSRKNRLMGVPCRFQCSRILFSR